MQNGWVRLVAVSECRTGCAKYVVAGEKELAVFRLAEPDRFIVTNNSCPHAGGNLAAGTIEGGQVTCPWHQWQFDLDSGTCTLSERVRLRQYECRVEDGFVYARLDH
jgi:nitrite reductase/ring-hydroxylating ferredoxin subunit